MKQVWLVVVVAQLAFSLAAYEKPPYEVYPYVGDEGDDPKLNYTKVCEPGRTGETQASYVILGFDYPVAYSAIDHNFSGDLVIPAYIDNLPVRKIEAAAFLQCQYLKRVRIPHTVREVGERAFANCYELTNIVFESGIQKIGDFAFSNCLALTQIKLPKTLSLLGIECFQGCLSLTDVYFEGNAPKVRFLEATDKSILGERIFRASDYKERFRVHIRENTYGWISPYEKGVPEKWPVESGFMQAHETVAEPNYDLESDVKGFVTVVTEIKGGAVAVPQSWSECFPTYQEKFGTDFSASLTKLTGKKDFNGQNLLVWHDYVAGTDPTDKKDIFKVTIKMTESSPYLEVYPTLSPAERARRKYTIWAKTRLNDTTWREIPLEQVKDYNFFKVSVELRNSAE